jgi:hypothetical protein
VLVLAQSRRKKRRTAISSRSFGVGRSARPPAKTVISTNMYMYIYINTRYTPAEGFLLYGVYSLHKRRSAGRVCLKHRAIESERLKVQFGRYPATMDVYNIDRAAPIEPHTHALAYVCAVAQSNTLNREEVHRP